MNTCVKSWLPTTLAALLLGCASGADIVKIGDNAWRVTTIDNTQFEVARVGTAQAIDVCVKQGKVPFFVASVQTNDMPGRHRSVMDFQCTASGSSPAAQAEARMMGFNRECAIVGYPLGSPENHKCANELSAKALTK